MEYILKNDNYYKFIKPAGLHKDNLKYFIEMFISINNRHPVVSDIYPELKGMFRVYLN